MAEARLTSRDLEMVASVHGFRALTSVQIARLHFPSRVGNPDPVGASARERLRLLVDQRLLQAVEQPVTLDQGRKPRLYLLTKTGAQLLIDREMITPDQLDWQPDHNLVGWAFLDHLLACNDIRIAFTTQAPQQRMEVIDWLDDHHLSSPSQKDEVVIRGVGGAKERAAVIPDGYFVLSTPSHRFRSFLEVDRSTVTVVSTTPYRRTWERKTRGYLAYFASPAFQKRYQTTKPFRVLTVTDSATRLAHLKEATEAAGGEALFWFTTTKELLDAGPLNTPIWQVAGQTSLACFPDNPKAPANQAASDKPTS